MTTELEVRYETSDAVATITLNRPRELNAVNLAVCEQIAAALDNAESDSTVRVSILTGVGRAFCAGADLKAFAAGEGPAVLAHRGGFGGFVRYTRTKPVIAAVNGHALAGGLELVLACDLAVASDTALFGLPEVTVGLVAGGGGALRLPRAIPAKAAMRILLTGKPFDAAEALRLHLINEVVPADEVLPAARALAEQIVAAAPAAVAASRDLALQALGSDDEADLWGRNDARLAAIFGSGDAREGMAAFIEKRRPVWQDR